MRRSLAWSLAGVAVLSVAAISLPRKATHIVQAIEARRSADPALLQSKFARPERPLPETLDQLRIEPARRDPFVAEVATDVPQMPAANVVPVTLPVPPPALVVPILQWRLLGTMEAPTGQRLVILADGNQSSLLAEAGMRLDGGFQIASVDSDAVRLTHPSSNVEVVIPIPPPLAAGR
jgi:hypothetical protein